MLFLGISDIAHDTAAALLEDARPVAAIEENKLSRASKTAGKICIVTHTRRFSAPPSDHRPSREAATFGIGALAVYVIFHP